jgi:Fe-S cluster assembly protein SufD
VSKGNAMGHFLNEIEKFDDQQAGTQPPWVGTLREFAAERFDQLGFPSTKHEEWRWTNISGVSQGHFAYRAQPANVDEPEILRSALCSALGEVSGPRLVLVNGSFAPALSDLGQNIKGLRLQGLAEALEESDPRIEAHLCRYANSNELAFAALNTAFLKDGAVIEIDEGACIDTPICIVSLATANKQSDLPSASYPRLLILAGSNSHATVVESTINLGDAENFLNTVSEVVVDVGASLTHVRLQNTNRQSLQVSTLQALLAEKSHYALTTFSLGGALTRNDLTVKLAGPEASCEVNGLCLLQQKQHVDNNIIVDHTVPNCTSSQIFKAILDDESRSIFAGKVIVRPDAQKTFAEQSNRSLLLSDRAEADSRPQLDIYADDVKCAHGATTGSLNEEALFYLRSRGISPETARVLLTEAFAREIAERIELESLREHVLNLLREKLGKDAVEELT